jgi:hypothetical protein
MIEEEKVSRIVVVTVIFLLLAALAGCGDGSIPEDAALRITGKVDKKIGWTEEMVRAMDAVKAQSTNSKGQADTYIGVPINDLLDNAGPKSGASTLVLVSGDGSEEEVSLDRVRACSKCIVSFRSKGGFSTIFPGFRTNAQVKGVVEIRVK